MTFETLCKGQRSFGLFVGFLMALYCLFNPSIISVWLSLSFLGLTVHVYENQLHVPWLYWWPLWQHSNRDSRKKQRNLCTSQHITIWMLTFRIIILASQPSGQVVFFKSKIWRRVHFLWEKWVTHWGENKKKIVGNIPFLTVFEKFCRVLSRKDMAFSRRFSNENVRSWPDSAA